MTIEIDDHGNVIGYLSVPQYCQKYGVKETTVRQWCNRNMIPHIKVGRETWIKDGAAPVYKYKFCKDEGWWERMIVYQCDPKRNHVCSKTDCGWLKRGMAVCFGTTHEEYAALDEKGVPIVTEIVKIEGSDQNE